MKRLYLLLLLPVLVSCFSEEKVDTGASDTFIRYFNGGFDDAAVALVESTDNGYVILANSTLEDGRNKIKLIKTNDQGNTLWSRVYPAFAPDRAGFVPTNQKAYGILVLPGGGYVIAGEDINAGKSQLLILVLDENGTVVSEHIYTTALSIRGLAIAENTLNPLSYVVLATILGTETENMVVGEILKSDLSLTWSRSYGSGEASLANKLFLDAQGKLIWGGTVVRQSKSDMRLVRAEQDKQNTDFDLPIGDPNFNEQGTDLCRYGFGYALVGSTNEKTSSTGPSTSGERDIMFKRLGEDGTVLYSASFPITLEDGTEVPGNKVGNSITTTRDGGLFLAGTVPSNDALGFGRGGTDYYLIKVDGFGNVIWQKAIGSRDEDFSVCVLQASDGGLILLGNTTLAGLKTIMLAKMDSGGNIE